MIIDNNIFIMEKQINKKYLFLLHVEIFDDNSDEEVESEERTKDDEENEVHVHARSILELRLLVFLQFKTNKIKIINKYV